MKNIDSPDTPKRNHHITDNNDEHRSPDTPKEKLDFIGSNDEHIRSNVELIYEFHI